VLSRELDGKFGLLDSCSLPDWTDASVVIGGMVFFSFCFFGFNYCYLPVCEEITFVLA
jgi:hypothetical protein